MLLLNFSIVKLRRKITHTFFIYKTFRNYLSKIIQKSYLCFPVQTIINQLK